jgi:hypothetical protein
MVSIKQVPFDTFSHILRHFRNASCNITFSTWDKCCWTSSNDPKCISFCEILRGENKKKSHRTILGEQEYVPSEGAVFLLETASAIQSLVKLFGTVITHIFTSRLVVTLFILPQFFCYHSVIHGPVQTSCWAFPTFSLVFAVDSWSNQEPSLPSKICVI